MGNKMFLKCLSVLLLVGLFVCCLVSCGKKESAENIPEASKEQVSDKGGQEQTADNDGNQLLGPDGERLAAQSREFEVQYIRTGLLKDTEALSAVSVIHSSNELKKYYEEKVASSLSFGYAEYQYGNDESAFDIDEKMKSLPYLFHDPHKMLNKIDIKKLQFGSRIDKDKKEREKRAL